MTLVNKNNHRPKLFPIFETSNIDMKKIGLFVSIIALVYYSCQKQNEFNTSPDFELRFSTDSIVFDTIFSGIGSTTRHLKVFNPSDKDVEIDQIYLAKANDSKYRINIDGKPATSDEKVLLKAKDSLYLFVEVTINTDQDALLEQDSIVFITNGNWQDIKLLAWGQDVHLIYRERINTTTWTNEKPYLVYDTILVNPNQTLRIDAGTKVYFHRNSRMYVAGTLQIGGTYDEPVILQGDRLEEIYNDVPGQWSGIHLLNGSKHNNINFAEIKDAIIGIQVDTLADETIPTLSIHNSKIEHMSFAGIYAQGSTIFATNCLISDCGFYTVALTIGGSYDFYHCTLANYWQNGFRNTPSVIINNYYTYENQAIIRDIEHAGFYNCLIYGDRENELFIDAFPDQGVLNYEFENCLLKITEDAEINTDYLTNCIENKEPLFVDIEKYNFAIDTLSPAIDKASRTWVDLYPGFLNLDLKNQSRISDNNPDIGAFEWVSTDDL